MEIKYIIPFHLRPIQIGQGFNGRSHRLWLEDREDFSYSLDFLLPEGTEIIAARSGIVSKVKDTGTKNYGGTDPDLGELAYLHDMNEIEIQHEDGTFAAYAHIQHKGSIFTVGDEVKQGQMIGYSGNTGWSSAPHLDFSVFRKNVEGFKIKSFKFSFEDYSGPLENADL